MGSKYRLKFQRAPLEFHTKFKTGDITLIQQIYIHQIFSPYTPMFTDTMMTSSKENIFCVTGNLCREITGHRCIPCTKANEVKFDVFFDLRLNKRLSKNGEADDFKRHRSHYDVIVMSKCMLRWRWSALSKRNNIKTSFLFRIISTTNSCDNATRYIILISRMVIVSEWCQMASYNMAIFITGNGFSLIRRKVITWTNDDLV